MQTQLDALVTNKFGNASPIAEITAEMSRGLLLNGSDGGN
jgi:hypothetical protein